MLFIYCHMAYYAVLHLSSLVHDMYCSNVIALFRYIFDGHSLKNEVLHNCKKQGVEIAFIR